MKRGKEALYIFYVINNDGFGRDGSWGWGGIHGRVYICCIHQQSTSRHPNSFVLKTSVPGKREGIREKERERERERLKKKENCITPAASQAGLSCLEIVRGPDAACTCWP